MDRKGNGITRRKLLASAIGFGGLAITSSAQTESLPFTPPMPMGPFYPVIKPLDRDADLTLLKGNTMRAKGQVIHLAGRVLNRNGGPVVGARIEIWQANSFGRYRHASDPNTEPIDPNFQGFCVLKSDNQGRYRFKTIYPGSYPGLISGRRTSHIHFDVSAKNDRLVTQMFFPGDVLNDQDVLFQNLRTDRAKAAATATLLSGGKDIPASERLYMWDIVLLTG